MSGAGAPHPPRPSGLPPTKAGTLPCIRAGLFCMPRRSEDAETSPGDRVLQTGSQGSEWVGPGAKARVLGTQKRDGMGWGWPADGTHWTPHDDASTNVEGRIGGTLRLSHSGDDPPLRAAVSLGHDVL